MSIIFVKDDEDDPLDAVFSQRIMLDEDETGHLIDILLPREDYVVKLPKKIALSSGIAGDEAGFAKYALEQGATSALVRARQTRTATLSSTRRGGRSSSLGRISTACPNLRMMIVIDII